MERSSLKKPSTYKMPLLILLTIIMLSAFPTYASGEYIESVATSGYCGNHWNGGIAEDLTWSFDNGTLTISGSGKMQLYSILYNPPWYPFKESIYAVLIEPGVEDVSDYAFVNAYNLETVSIPDTVCEIGVGSFSNCIHLKSIELPDPVMEIGDNAFENCISLEDIILDNNLIRIGSFAFASCTGLKSITIPDSVTTIEWTAFSGCNSLETVHIGSGFNNHGLENPWEVEFITNNWRGFTKSIPWEVGEEFSSHDWSFGFLSGLIDSNALKRITVGDDSMVLKSVDGVLFDATGEVLIRYPKQRQDIKYTIPDGVKTIYRRAFEDCSYLEHVDFPESLECIREEAFCGCTSLKEIDIPKGVNFESIESFDPFGKGELPVPHCCFKDCVGLQTVFLPQLSEHMFEGCKNLKNVTIRTEVSEEEWRWPKNAFINCFALERITLEGYINKTFLFPKALEVFGESFIYGYDFISDDNKETENNTEVMKGDDSRQQADYYEYYDENNPYCDVIDLGGGVCAVHQDGSVSSIFPTWAVNRAWADNSVRGWSDIKQVIACDDVTGPRYSVEDVVGLKNDGTLVYTSDGDFCNFTLDPITQWQNVNEIELLGDGWGIPYAIVLTKDGCVLSQCYWLSGQLADWTDIVDLACWCTWGDPYDLYLVGIKRNGSLCSVNTSYTWLGSTDHVVSIKKTPDFTDSDLIAINDDGTVVVTSGLSEIAYELSQWENIKQIECFDGIHVQVVGLKNDGTLVTTGGYFPEAESWKSVVSIVCPGLEYGLFAIDEEGKVLECGANNSYDNWRNIEKLYWIGGGLVGVTYDGHLISDHELGL